MSEEEGAAAAEEGGKVETNFEELATKQGWTPKDEYKGDADRWVDAETFVERGKSINPILRKNNEALEKTILKLNERLDKQDASAAEFKKYHEATEQRAYASALKEIEGRKAEAVENEDVAAYQKAEKEGNELVAPVTARAEQISGNHPEWDAWLTENSWYADNPEAHAIADGLVGLVNRQTGLDGAKLFDAVKERVKQRMPEAFGQTRKAVAAVETGGGIAKNGKKGYSDLPAADKAICDSFVSDGYLTKEQYMKDYTWSEA